MPDPVNTETIVTPAPDPNQTPQSQTREALYQQYYQTANPDGTPVDPAQPIATSTAAPETPVDYKSLFTAMQAEMASLKESINKPAAAVVPPEPVAPKPDWFELLQAGKRTEAEQALIEFVTNGAAEKIKQQTLIESAELTRTERTIEDFNNEIRSTNPDLLDVEDFVSLKAEQIFKANQGNIKSTKDYIDTYKGAVSKAVEDVRKVLQRTRAVAKAEAMTTRREVLATQTMSPNDFSLRDNRNGQNEGQPQAPDTSPTTYLEMRKQTAEAKRNPYMAATRQTVGL